jgi:membrane fusion protein (multidrug efflux system)
VSPQSVITTIRQKSMLKLDFTLPEKFTSKLQTGQLVSFTTEGNNKIYKAKVIATESGMQEDNRSLQVRSIIINNDGDLLPGAFAKVKLDFEPDPNAIDPSQSILPLAGKQVVVCNEEQ